MRIQPASAEDWPLIWPIWHRVVSSGETYCWDPDTDQTTARRLWMLPQPAEVWVAAEETVVGTAVLKPNQPGLGDHVANASFMVDPDAAGRGVGRELGRHIIDRAKALGYRAMQFNAVVSTNERAVRLWQSLGFEIVGTVPRAYRHSRHGLVDLHVMHQSW
ncbi:GNAT family N-acetyltransferase [Rugosimonospora acidiphila]|uniref:GNAT family N-acetyltransferase n=1 Tax=Rugosimonospora acidiphila TaxID=556531 RepID=A0ABP9RHD5_9ACTN